MKKLIVLSFLVVLISFNTGYSYAQTQSETTSDGSIDVRIEPSELELGKESKVKVEFLNPQTGDVQVHIDYTIQIENNDQKIFGPIPLTHTSLGTVTIPVTFQEGSNIVTVGVEGILFVPIPKETATFEVVLGEKNSENLDDLQEEKESQSRVPEWVKNNAGWWATDQIDDGTFVSGIQFLIKEGIISVSQSTDTLGSGNDIPPWIKNNAGWWSEGLITDDDFLKGIEFLVSSGIISISFETPNETLQIGGVDLSQASPLMGFTDAPITIIEFGDYQCPNCKRWFDNTKPDLVANYIDTGKTKLFFIDAIHLGSDSISAARASYCAEDQGEYWEYHDYLYSNAAGIQNGWADTESLKEYAVEIGLDSEKFASCIDSDNHENRVKLNIQISSDNNIGRTPTFIIVGESSQETISGPQPYSIFVEVIESLLTT